uniref:Uncharacterized protein n=1 Tax=Klebsiella pneumoniae TaxID=573 RepID=A0A8B0SXB2_KLEPN|nr:hypothetical protein [Klebsiella pneumoniae]
MLIGELKKTLVISERVFLTVLTSMNSPPFRYGVNGSPNLLALLNTGMRPDNNHLWFCFYE